MYRNKVKWGMSLLVFLSQKDPIAVLRLVCVLEWKKCTRIRHEAERIKEVNHKVA